MTYHLETWQRVVDALLLLVMSFGFGAIVVAIRGPRRVRMNLDQRKRLGTVGGAIFLVGVAARLHLSDALAPIAKPPPPPVVPADELTEARFVSAGAPAVSVDAPLGWRIAFAEDSRRLTMADGAGDVLVIFSRQLDEQGSASSVRTAVRSDLEGRGLTTVEFEDAIDGRPALGLIAVEGESAIASFVVDRGGRYVSVLQCRAPKDRDARAACRPALAQLHWLTPAR
jgi:hypothetical protein